MMAPLLEALDFAARKHRLQKRMGGEDPSPYINHPIEVARIVASVGGISDIETLQAAVLHDTVEDTATTPAEVRAAFGAEVLSIVLEVTDDKALPKEERKRLQVLHAPSLSGRAKLIRIADKISNISEVVHRPPPHWTFDRRVRYLEWAAEVVEGCRGASPSLERFFDEVLRECRVKLREQEPSLGGSR